MYDFFPPFPSYFFNSKYKTNSFGALLSDGIIHSHERQQDTTLSQIKLDKVRLDDNRPSTTLSNFSAASMQIPCVHANSVRPCKIRASRQILWVHANSVRPCKFHGGKGKLNQLMSHRGVCRTALSTPGLVIIKFNGTEPNCWIECLQTRCTPEWNVARIYTIYWDGCISLQTTKLVLINIVSTIDKRYKY